MVDEPTTPAAPASSPSAPSSSPSGNPPASAPVSAPASLSPATTPSSPAAATRPAYIPESHWDATGGKVKDEAAFAKYINDHVAFKAADDSRRLTLPQKPEDYQLKLTQGFKAPDGIEFVPDEKDPLLPQARAFAQKHGLTQDAFSELLDLHAAGQVGSQQHIKDAKAAEVAKLGVNGPARKTAVDTWLKAQLGNDDLAKHMSEFMFTSRQVEGFEMLMARARTQGAASFSHQHREPPQEPGKISQAEYDKLTPAARLDYARQFPQPAMNGGRQ